MQTKETMQRKEPGELSKPETPCELNNLGEPSETRELNRQSQVNTKQVREPEEPSKPLLPCKRVER